MPSLFPLSTLGSRALVKAKQVGLRACHVLQSPWRLYKHIEYTRHGAEARSHLFPGWHLDLKPFGSSHLLVIADEPVIPFLQSAAHHDDRALPAIAAALAAQDKPLIYLDIGTNYGVDLCHTAKILLKARPDAHIAAFEPGCVRHLVPHNLALNGLDKAVSYYQLAVAGHVGFVELYGEPNASEDNRIVNKGPRSKSTLVPCTTIDSYMDALNRPGAPLFIKIDTQGAEPLVFAGAKASIAAYPCVINSEFVPGTFPVRTDAIAFLKTCRTTHELFDLGANHDHCLSVPDDLESYAESVHASPDKWTDLLLLPRNAPAISAAIKAKLGL